MFPTGPNLQDAQLRTVWVDRLRLNAVTQTCRGERRLMVTPVFRESRFASHLHRCNKEMVLQLGEWGQLGLVTEASVPDSLN